MENKSNTPFSSKINMHSKKKKETRRKSGFELFDFYY